MQACRQHAGMMRAGRQAHLAWPLKPSVPPSTIGLTVLMSGCPSSSYSAGGGGGRGAGEAGTQQGRVRSEIHLSIGHGPGQCSVQHPLIQQTAGRFTAAAAPAPAAAAPLTKATLDAATRQAGAPSHSGSWRPRCSQTAPVHSCTQPSAHTQRAPTHLGSCRPRCHSSKELYTRAAAAPT